MVLQDNFSHINFENFRSIADIICDLSKPVKVAPRQGNSIGHLEVRKQGGKDILYISWTRAAQYLDYYAPGWFKEIVRMDSIGGKLIVTVRLYIPAREGMFWRESTGQEDESTDSWGDSSSNAESMAFRRAAANFGLCRYLYDISENQRAQLLSGNQIQVPIPTPKGFEQPVNGEAVQPSPEEVKPAQNQQEAQSGAVEETEEDTEIDPFSEKKPVHAALDALIEKALANGFKENDIVTAARIYCQQNDIRALTAEQIAEIDRRMTARIEKSKPKAEAKGDMSEPQPIVTRNQLEQLEFLAQKLRAPVVDLAKEFSDGSALVFEDLTGDQATKAIRELTKRDKAQKKK